MDVRKAVDILRGPKEDINSIFSDLDESVEIRNQNFDGLDFSGVDLNRREFLSFVECSFRGANFAKAKMPSILAKCDFTGANMKNAYFRSKLTDCSLVHVNMTKSKLNIPSAEGCDFSNVKGVLTVIVSKTPIFLRDAGKANLYLTIGCTSMPPHRFYRSHALTHDRLTNENTFHKPVIIVPVVCELLQQACAINRDDPTQWQGAPAELAKVEAKIYQLLPAQHPVRNPVTFGTALLDTAAPA